MSKASHVTVEWLEQCLALQKRLPEKIAGHFSQARDTAKAKVSRGVSASWCMMAKVLKLYDHAGKTCGAAHSRAK